MAWGRQREQGQRTSGTEASNIQSDKTSHPGVSSHPNASSLLFLFKGVDSVTSELQLLDKVVNLQGLETNSVTLFIDIVKMVECFK